MENMEVTGTNLFGQTKEEYEAEILSSVQEKVDNFEKLNDTDTRFFNYNELTKRIKYREGIDITNRETHLSDEEFESVMGMTRNVFLTLKPWKKNQLKKKVDLF